ncbi:MAG: hypothetical protein RDU25_06305, partial [Patescibacteria group bacterium]|nr:hypothetical protein [Patescibacteria group bacterium]
MSTKTSRTFFLSSRYVIGNIFVAILAILSFLVVPVSAASSVPHFVNYQGKLLTSAGAAVTDGTYALKFSIYDTS